MNSELASKNILGYTLKERIGSGGFGEVWSAIAPGGLMKAVKIVYGYHDEKRAQAELKALDRVKEVRHPFLLSLERIEVHQGQLIVVSELADKSMADLFNEYVMKGEPGIPRDELLKYIRGAADALDYLTDEHGLQHLDIKPENLLIASGHVKVADFGLIKSLENASQSLMSGMTPAYAAPELFDGRPGSRSDQYSLAIVYQEMLTAVRPYPGTTPAQLAAQHMHGKPNLRPLPQGDQAVLAKALAKDPSVRFESCRAMAEELANKKRTTKKAIRRIQSTTRAGSDTDNTIALESNTALISSDGLPFQVKELKLEDPPECDSAASVFQPVLIVGVGATGNRIAQQFKEQMLSRHQSMEEVPSVRILCVDTDRSEITKLVTAGEDSALTASETIEASLSKPEVYRSKAQHLNWMSRRWIYNIPRTLQTEGLRPLGRLAFADHFDKICDSIDDAIKQIMSPENLAKSSETLELDPGPIQPRVFIVSSISGGVGSGMMLDLAYTIKLLMAEHGLKSDMVSGIMLHSSYQRTRDPGLAAANAFAFMTELRHFAENGYPGDPSIGLPEFEDEPPFDYTYFNELGNDLSQTDLDQKLNSIAEYIYLSATSKCQVFFDGCRAFDEDLEHFGLRTFGLSFCGPGNGAAGMNAASQLAHALTQRWIHGKTDSEFDPNQCVDRMVEPHDLATESVISIVSATTNDLFEGNFHAIANGAKDIAKGRSSDRIDNFVAYLDGALGCPPSRRDSSHADSEICLQMEEKIGTQAMVVGDALASEIFELLSGDTLDLSRVDASANALLEKLEMSGQQVQNVAMLCAQQTEQKRQIIADIPLEKLKSKTDSQEAFEQAFGAYSQLRFEEFVLRYSANYFRVLRNSVATIIDTVKGYKSSLEHVASGFADMTISTDNYDDDTGCNIDQLLVESIDDELENHISRTQIQVFESLVKEIGGYQNLLKDSSCIQNRLPNEILNASQRILADAYKKISLEEVISKNRVGAEQVVKWVNEKVLAARPVIDDCGGSSRVLLGIPALSSASQLPKMLETQFGLKVKLIKGTRGSFVICFETENVSLANVAYRLLQLRPDAVELVKRIHTRNDVDWSTLNDLL